MLANCIEGLTALLALAGIAYMALVLWGARDFHRTCCGRRTQETFAPDVSILKPVKGIDQHMYAGFVSHCSQQYAGRYEILFGVSSLSDPAVAEIERLKAEFPAIAIRLPLPNMAANSMSCPTHRVTFKTSANCWKTKTLMRFRSPLRTTGTPSWPSGRCNLARTFTSKSHAATTSEKDVS